MPQNRLFGVAAVLAKGVCAGSIASSNGSATVTPAPRRNVRRERCFFEMKFIVPVSLWTPLLFRLRPIGRALRGSQNFLSLASGTGRFEPRPKPDRKTYNDSAPPRA